MKKITALLFCMIFLLSACSGKTEFNESDILSYVGEGEMTMIRMLVDTNGFFVEDVFVAGHLPVDEKNTVENADGTFALVVSDKIKSYAELESMVRSTYAAKAADKLLSDGRYQEINGKLYFNMKYNESSDYSLDWSESKTQATVTEEGKYEITTKIKGGKITLYAVKENGNMRLENIYS